MELIPQIIEKYVAEHSDSVPPLLEELEKETYEKTGYPQMLTGRVEGLFLQMLVRITGAKKVVDIGTFTGYSALMMAAGLPEGGGLTTCEIEEAHAAIARKYFMQSEHGSKIRLVLGPAIDTLRKIAIESVDFIFMDADKTSYGLYYEESIRILKKGGLMTVDNTLWYGRVLSPEDDNSRAIVAFNETVRRDDRVEKVLLTIRDGITLIRKK